MEISISKLTGIIVSIAVAGVVGYSCYFLYGILFTGPKADGSTVLTSGTVSILGPKLQSAGSAIVDPVTKISLNRQKDLQFLDSALFKSFTDLPVTIPPTNIRGRADPFVPYVAP